MARNEMLLDSPYARAFAITPHDTNALTEVTRAVYVGGAGAIVVNLQGQQSTDITLAAVPVGTVLRIKAYRIKSTGTTATNLVGLY